MPNLEQEQWCKEELRAWLQANHRDHDFKFERGGEPPDFWLYVDGARKLAVEVTRVADGDERTVQNSLAQVVDAADREALEAGVLNGEYHVEFNHNSAHYLDFMKRPARNELKLRILDYVRQTRRERAPASTLIEIGSRPCCRISKRHHAGAVIGWLGFDTDSFGWEPEIRDALASQLSKPLRKKAHVAMRCGTPTILVLYDLFRLADPEWFRECVSVIPESGRFTLVYVVQDEGRGFPIGETAWEDYLEHAE